MPRFVCQPVVVEAHRHDQLSFPPDFIRAIRRNLSGGSVEIMCFDGPRACAPGDWVARDRDGTFSVWPQAKFEMFFAELIAAPPEPPSDPVLEVPEALPMVAKRPYVRRERVDG